MFYLFKIEKEQIKSEIKVDKKIFHNLKDAYNAFEKEYPIFKNDENFKNYRREIFITTDENILNKIKEIPIRVNKRIGSVIALDGSYFRYMFVTQELYEDKNLRVLFTTSKKVKKEAVDFFKIKTNNDFALFENNFIKKGGSKS